MQSQPMPLQSLSGWSLSFTGVRNHQGGFTLLEVMVVLTIIAAMLALVVPQFSQSTISGDLLSASNKTISMLRIARSESIYKSQPVNFYVDVKKKSFYLDDRREQQKLSDALHVKLFTARSQLTSENIGYIRFFPDGSATGGRITLSGGKNRHVIDVNWLTGKVDLQTGKPKS